MPRVRPRRVIRDALKVGTSLCSYPREPVTGGMPSSAVAVPVTESFAEDALARALAVLADDRRDDDEREDAGCVVQLLLRRMQPSEAEIVDVFHALSRSLEVHLAARWILGALSSLRPPIVDKLAGAVERLIEREYVEGRFDNLAEVLLVVLDEPIWTVRIREGWVRAAVVDAVERLPETKTVVALLIGGWTLARSEDVGWMRDLAEERPQLVTDGRLPLATRWQLLRAAPTSAAWLSIASARGNCPDIDAEFFGPHLVAARESLRLALADAPDDSSKLALSRWAIALAESGPT